MEFFFSRMKEGNEKDYNSQAKSLCNWSAEISWVDRMDSSPSLSRQMSADHSASFSRIKGKRGKIASREQISRRRKHGGKLMVVF